MSDEDEGGEDLAPQQSKEDRAKARGWAPKEKWRGHPEDWVDADRFLEIAETSLPFIKSENKRLQAQNEELRQRFQSTQSDFDRRLRASEAANRKTLEIQKRNLLRQFEDEKRAALEIEDPQVRRAAYAGALNRERDAFQGIVREEQELNAQFAPPQQQGQQVPEEIQQWGKKNPWISYVPQELRIEAIEVMQGLDQSSPEMPLTQRLDTVTAVMKRRHPQWFPPGQMDTPQDEHDGDNRDQGRIDRPRRPVSAVEGGSGISGGRAQGNKAKSFKDLPSEAKSAFNSLIREGRLGRPPAGVDEATWRASMQLEYASNYWMEYGE